MMLNALSRTLVASLALGFGVLSASSAKADLTLYDKDGWTLKHGGLAQGFYVAAFGDADPTGGDAGAAAPIRFDFLGGKTSGNGAGSGNSFYSSRFRSGWAGSRFNWSASKKMSDTMTATGILGVAYGVSTYNAPPAPNNAWDVRNAHIKIEDTWGELLIGRNVGLYTLGSIISEATMTSAPLGLGNPCSAAGDGLSCYEAGYGVKFPGFWAGLFYTTPSLGGLKIKLAILDPTSVGANRFASVGGMMVQYASEYARNSLPMMQTFIMYEKTMGSLTLKPFFNGFWERAGLVGGAPAGTSIPDTIDPWGAGGGLDVFVGVFKIGAGGTYENGTAMYGPIFGGDPVDAVGKLRKGYSFYVHALATLGKVDVSAGFGQAGVTRSDDDVTKNLNINKNQNSIRGSVVYNMDPLAWVLEWNHAKHLWYANQTQTVDFVVLSASFSY